MKPISIVYALSAALPLVSARHHKRDGGMQPTRSSSSSSSTATSDSDLVSVIEFENLGFSGTYNRVKSFKNIYSDDCSCEVDSTPVQFSGTNAPLNEELAVHFRGPLILDKFAYYVSPDYEYGDSSSSDWTRKAYYDASSQTTSNVTFLTRAGRNSSCLGKALTYADSDGVSKASKSTVLKEDTLINSADEYVIMSNVSCESSGLNKDCGVYRSGIPAFHGYYGTIKMFLFQFQMPTETKVSNDSVSNWNMPAIWLLDASIARTAQYSTSTNCSCWTSGCGEFDIFEVLNVTEANHLYSTIHDFQGTGSVEIGLSAYGHMTRDTSGTMVGGVSFDKGGNAIVWLSNSTSFDETIAARDVDSWIDDAGDKATDKLQSIKAASTSTSSSKSKAGGSNLSRHSFINVALASITSAVLGLLV